MRAVDKRNGHLLLRYALDASRRWGVRGASPVPSATTSARDVRRGAVVQRGEHGPGLRRVWGRRDGGEGRQRPWLRRVSQTAHGRAPHRRQPAHGFRLVLRVDRGGVRGDPFAEAFPREQVQEDGEGRDGHPQDKNARECWETHPQVASGSRRGGWPVRGMGLEAMGREGYG